MDARILVVDDVEANRDLLMRRLAQQGWRADGVGDGETALARLATHEYDLVLLDLMMPGMDGIEVLRALKADDRLRHLPVIVVSASDEMANVVPCIELGAEDYLPKPFNPVLLRARVMVALARKRLHDQEAALRQVLHEHNLRLKEQVRAQVREITSAQAATIFAMSRLAESREPHASGRLDRLREYARALAQQPRHHQVIDAVFLDAIYAVTPLLDIGKVALPDGVLAGAGSVDPAEWEVLKQHTLIGGEMLRAVDRQHPGNAFIRMGMEIAEGHHEQWDGGGYPRGVASEAIPFAARIVALVDVYDGLTAPAAGHTPFTHDQAKDIVVAGAGRHFDPDVVTAFLAAEAEFVGIRGRFRQVATVGLAAQGEAA